MSAVEQARAALPRLTGEAREVVEALLAHMSDIGQLAWSEHMQCTDEDIAALDDGRATVLDVVRRLRSREVSVLRESLFTAKRKVNS